MGERVRLRELDAHFVIHVVGGHRVVPSLEQAQGVLFQCPRCAQGKPPGEPDGVGFAGAHYVLCWFRNPRSGLRVPDDVDPRPGRWDVAGTSLDDLSFVGPAAASVHLPTGCGWHGYIRNGDATLS
jgi:hypothetical protein